MIQSYTNGTNHVKEYDELRGAVADYFANGTTPTERREAYQIIARHITRPTDNPVSEQSRRAAAWDELEEERDRYHRSPQAARRYIRMAYANGANSFDLEKWAQAHGLSQGNAGQTAELEAEKLRVLAELGIPHPEASREQ